MNQDAMFPLLVPAVGAGAARRSECPRRSATIAPPAISFFFTYTPTTEIYTSLHTLSLHDALPIYRETGEENCIGCRLCEFICPPAVIKVEMLKGEKRNYAKFFSLELYACEFCELCVQVCPTDAIIMMKSFDLSTSDRREMLLDKDRLHAIGLQHDASWATGNKLRDMQAPPKKVVAEAEKPSA